jgi:hypothetical protein
MAGEIATGTYTGTGSSINIPLGWVPDYVRVVNFTDGDVTHEWFYGMTDGASVDTAAAVVSNASGSIGALSSTTLGYGFVTGADASESAKVYYFVAVKSGQQYP